MSPARALKRQLAMMHRRRAIRENRSPGDMDVSVTGYGDDVFMLSGWSFRSEHRPSAFRERAAEHRAVRGKRR